MRDDVTEIILQSVLFCAAKSKSSMGRETHSFTLSRFSSDGLEVYRPLKCTENSLAQRVVPHNVPKPSQLSSFYGRLKRLLYHS
ncbi:hypothetical protein DPMN_038804 [Dreissena polymorpha]|uniref:Uncharacterized protein n=1 Tax=Dreissena polymorpha TaxID=45954 RepID=A0A9D4RNK4_DREPO|nr:hypothetical protein DPMN_038804 [Dreissena polymorpha]